MKLQWMKMCKFDETLNEIIEMKYRCVKIEGWLGML